MTTTETAAARIVRLDTQHRDLCERRAAGTLPQAIIDRVELLDPDFMWDRAAADAALAASSEIEVEYSLDPDEDSDEFEDQPSGSVILVRAEVVADRGLLNAFLSESPTAFSMTLAEHCQSLAEADTIGSNLPPEADPLSADDEMHVALWLLVRARELKTAQAAQAAS